MSRKEYRQAPHGFFDEASARKYAREHLANTRIAIIQSVHWTSVFNFWIDSPDAFLCCWESVVFTGNGGKA